MEVRLWDMYGPFLMCFQQCVSRFRSALLCQAFLQHALFRVSIIQYEISCNLFLGSNKSIFQGKLEF